jgi:hypothetical protein
VVIVPVTSAFERLRQEDLHFQTTLSYKQRDHISEAKQNRSSPLKFCASEVAQATFTLSTLNQSLENSHVSRVQRLSSKAGGGGGGERAD